MTELKTISLIVPSYNEEKNINNFYKELKKIWQEKLSNYNYEIIFVDDGSVDKTSQKVEKIAENDKNVKLVQFSRNFGKEVATTAGFDYSTGDAVMMVDADLQYPLERIPEFVRVWSKGHKLVVGLRDKKQTNNLIEKVGSSLFYKIMNLIGETPVVAGALDFRLLDKEVVKKFIQLKEKSRITRTLIDWLGYEPVYVSYQEKPRMAGTASYSFMKRLNLALSAFTSHSFAPLKAIGVFGFIVTLLSGLLGFLMFLDRFIISPRPFSFSGNDMLATLNVFLIGWVLMALGLMSYYIASIKREVLGRPLYVIKKTINF